jgi:hypothetical protein
MRNADRNFECNMRKVGQSYGSRFYPDYAGRKKKEINAPKSYLLFRAQNLNLKPGQ